MSDLDRLRTERDSRQAHAARADTTRYSGAINRYLGALGYHPEGPAAPAPGRVPTGVVAKTGLVLVGVDDSPTGGRDTMTAREVVMSVDTEGRKRAGRRAGYVVAAAVNVVLLYLVNGRPGWEVVPFLTAGMTKVLPLINLSLVAGIAVNLVYLIRDPRWLVAVGGLFTTGVGLAAVVRLWQVFPFDFATGSPWATIVRILLLLGMAGSVIGLIVQLVALVRAAAGRPFSG